MKIALKFMNIHLWIKRVCIVFSILLSYILLYRTQYLLLVKKIKLCQFAKVDIFDKLLNTHKKYKFCFLKWRAKKCENLSQSWWWNSRKVNLFQRPCRTCKKLENIDHWIVEGWLSGAYEINALFEAFKSLQKFPSC